MQHIHHLLGEYRDDELPARQRAQVEAHLRCCPLCREKLEHLDRLADVLAEYGPPVQLTRPDVFRSQVVLRLSRRQQRRSGYASWAWHLIPLSLIGVLLCLEALLVLPDLLELAANVVRWMGGDLGALLNLPSSGYALLRYLAEPRLYPVLRAAWQMLVGIVLLLVFIPYVGWISVLGGFRKPPGYGKER